MFLDLCYGKVVLDLPRQCAMGGSGARVGHSNSDLVEAGLRTLSTDAAAAVGILEMKMLGDWSWW